MAQLVPTLGVDFGTSNSAAGFAIDGTITRIDLGAGQETMPTTFFFDFESRKTLMGHPANAALQEGAEGRYMRALKRTLGTPLMHEPRQLLNERVTFVEVIARFLRQIKARAEAQTGLKFKRAISGRPVVFHGVDHPHEAAAQDDLRACYLAAGFEEVRFLPEPEAAALASGAAGEAGALGVIVDIGGGTSDFSVFRTDRDGITILANHGVRIGGTDFDRQLSIDHVMPLFGKGTDLRDVFGPGTSPAPVAIYNDLATWEKIPFLYTPQTKRQVAEFVRLATAPDKMRRLHTVLDHEIGHDVAFAVEAGKIAANAGEADAQIRLGLVEKGLALGVSSQGLECSLTSFGDMLSSGVNEVLNRSNLRPLDVDRVIYVGGSSLMSVVGAAMRRELPDAEHSFADVFSAVADGLALAAGRA